MTKTRDLADLGGGFIQAGTGAVQRTVESKLQDVVSVKDFGAVGDGVTDDTAAIQAAIDYAETESVRLKGGASIFIPNGEYLVSATLTIQDSQINIYGEGFGTQITINSNMGDVFLIADANPVTTQLSQCGIHNIFIYYSVECAGAAIHVKNVSRLYIENVSVQGGGDQCIYIEGADSVYLANCDLQSGRRLTANKGDTAQIRIGGLWNGSTLVKPSASIYIDACQLRADTTNTYVESSLLIGQSDGIYINSTHFGVARSNILLRPERTNSPLEKIYFTGCYIDGNVEVTETCLRLEDSTGGTHGSVFRFVSFASCIFSRPEIAAILNNSPTASNIQVVGCQFQGGDKDLILFNDPAAGNTFTLTGCTFIQANRSLTTPASDIRFTGATTFSNVMISGCSFGSTDVTSSIGFNGSEDDITITGCTFVKQLSGVFSGKTIRVDNCIGLTTFLTRNYGVAVIGSDANGQFTITHDLMGTPTYASLSLRGDTVNQVQVVSVTNSTITGRLHNASGGDVVSSPGWNVYWKAEI